MLSYMDEKCRWLRRKCESGDFSYIPTGAEYTVGDKRLHYLLLWHFDTPIPTTFLLTLQTPNFADIKLELLSISEGLGMKSLPQC